MNYQTLNDALLDRCSSELFVNFINGVNDESRLNFDELYKRARQWLYEMQQQGIKQGDELIFFLKDNQTFIEAFWACILGGIIPVPVAVGISDEHRSKLFRIFKRLKNPYLLIDSKASKLLAAYAQSNKIEAEYAKIADSTLLTDKFEFNDKQGIEHTLNKNDIAFIQFSSGSTRDPKGVVLTHGNLLTTMIDMGTRAEYSEKDIALSWMPLTHDLGLIGFHINMLIYGICHHIMTTDLFSRRPLAWMQKTSEKRATVLSSPNFGYKHYLKVHQSRKEHDLDLSCIRIIMNGAEPISVALCKEFTAEMGVYGLSTTATYTCYGLAEAALGVSMPKPGSEFEYLSVDRNSLIIGQKVKYTAETAANAVRYVIEGPALDRCAVRIGDEQGNDVGEDVVGELLLKGPNVTSGYYNDEESNEGLFTSEGYLRTGDLGFLYKGQIVITGRLKDIIFANGLNYYPHDLEAVAMQSPDVELGKVVAVGVRVNESDHDDIIVCVLYRADLKDFVPIVREVKQLINEHIGLEVTHVLPVKRIPKTTSGKVQRRFFAEAYSNGQFSDDIIAINKLLNETKTSTDINAKDNATLVTIAGIFSDALPEKSINEQDNFFEIGLSSLDLATFQEKLD